MDVSTTPRSVTLQLFPSSTVKVGLIRLDMVTERNLADELARSDQLEWIVKLSIEERS